MSRPQAMAVRSRVRARSSALPLAWAWWAVIVYASLFPFQGWRGAWVLPPAELLGLPWPRYFIPFDITSNLLGYLPLGVLAALARLRHGGGAWSAVALATAAGALTSYAMEVTQHFLPQRVPSLLDWVLNSLGTLLGALLAAVLHWSGLLRRWQLLRERWLDEGNGGAMALLLLWPAALLFPAPVPLGLGQVWATVQPLLAGLLAGVPWAEPLAHWLAEALRPADGLSTAGEVLAVLLGTLAPCLLAFAAAPRLGRRLWLVTGAVTVGFGAGTLSTALNFGPDHALAWLTPTALTGMAAGLVVVLALALARVDARIAAALGLMVLTGLVLLVNQAATDPYFAQSLRGWEQGRFIRFHGLAQWLGWLWPYAAMAWLLGRVGRGSPGGRRRRGASAPA